MPSNTIASCQHSDLRTGSRLLRPYPLVMLERLWYHLVAGGPLRILRQCLLVWRRTHRAAGKREPDPVRSARERLNLQAGEWVRVKPASEIRQTLDAAGALRGLVFLDEMWQFCDQAFRVHKRLEQIFVEGSKEVRRVKDTVLLEGVCCSGAGIGCDRSCFFFWREAWLTRLAAPAAACRPGA
jgi:hypothetical protein